MLKIRSPRTGGCLSLLVLMLVTFGPGARVLAGEFYYVMVFGSQSHPKQLRFTHTWATFIKAEGEGTDPSGYSLQVHTISWLPATLDVRVLAPRAETGVNLELEDTLRAMLANREQITMWGPFVITPALYERSLRVREILHSGAARYRAISNARDLLISDCIHAVAAVDPIFGRRHYPLIRIGKPASRFIAREIMIRSEERHGIDQAQFDHSWLIPRIGLDAYPVEVISPRQIPRRDCFLCLIPE